MVEEEHEKEKTPLSNTENIKENPRGSIILNDGNNTTVADIEEFFHDDHNTPWEWKEHDLEQSLCRSIIYQDGEGFYYCRLHPQIRYENASRPVKLRNLDLGTIEHHCKYYKPEVHKTEILRLLGTGASS